MLKIGEFFMIRELYQKGWTQTAIAKETGFDRKTIRKYLKGDKLPERKANGKKKASKLDPYKNYLLQRIQEGTTNCVVLFEEIQAMGYTGKMTILRDFVRPYREQPKKQATLRYETPPGKQAQMDWAYVGKYLVDGQYQDIYAFVMVLGYSRMKYVEFTTNMNVETLMKCHMNAFAYFNGIPEQILYDNMKTVVLKHSPIEIRFNRVFEDFLAYYGIVPKACRPKRPQTKGKVERVVKYLKDNFFQRKHEPTLYALNEDVRTWLDQVANQKPNQTTNEPPIQRFEQEQKFLQAWGIKPLFPTCRWETREVSRDCFVSYRGKKYTVPYRYAGQVVKVKETLDHHIEIYDEHECIAKHPILTGKATAHIQMEHYEGLHTKEKGRRIKDVQVLAANDLYSSAPSPKVEQRPLAAYAALEEGETV
ncbi:IS21 family transposase [Geobacillus stearothermophilus]|uniref:IS21 family transposase n=1 Tax=Geobacillus stearothermophilus TaxID=1422 RepID=UPI002E217F14|nr:IS21 family transposase [Geobacillus stearothermophilus]MED4271587.1 IS21 family transposase [Geobacillus stearothermophilus]